MLFKMNDKKKWFEFSAAIPKSFYDSLIAAKIVDSRTSHFYKQNFL